MDPLPAEETVQPIPFVKQADWGDDFVSLGATQLHFDADRLGQEGEFLQSLLNELQIPRKDGGLPITLEIGQVDFPPIDSIYRTRIEAQGYRLSVGQKEIRMVAPTSAGVFYGIQTFAQLIVSGEKIREVEIVDWPDLPVRMIMVDPARQNENMDYYRKLIQFCARYKINSILCHLTDDQTACLAHEDYPELMHPHAWTTEQIRELVDFAGRQHIELTPEIESFGHSRMFVRRSDFREILHQTDGPRTISWMGTDVPGYTNVLCPASDKSYEYLDRMYERATAGFPAPFLHIGCDEVDMTRCARCEKQFPGVSKSDWFLAHLLRCRSLAAKHGKATALWGDMLLKHPEIARGFPTDGTLIFDWHYRENVDDSSVKFFKGLGFEIIASPALVCSPHMILPDEHNYTNIRRFAEIARDQDVLGLNTTIWIPTRYLSDVLWPGIAFAAVHSWSGSNWEEDDFYSGFLSDFFGSEQGEAFSSTWNDLSKIIWHRKEFNTSCWRDNDTLKEAQKWLATNKHTLPEAQQRLQSIQGSLEKIGQTVTKNHTAWTAIERSAAILAYAFEHLLAAPKVQMDEGWNIALLSRLDKDSVQAIAWIEEDWDRNRYADDPNKDGLYLASQHLLYRFKQMHAFHQSILNASSPQGEP